MQEKKAREWRIRLAEEIRHNKSYFVTLTIDDDNLETLKNELGVKTVKGNENNIATLALRKFLERCRKKTGKSLKHWCVTELGEDRGRIHLHGIFFGNQAAELVIEKWKYGYVFIGNYVNEKTINYISKYMLKDDLNNREFTGKVLTSAGMGKQYKKTIVTGETIERIGEVYYINTHGDILKEVEITLYLILNSIMIQNHTLYILTVAFSSQPNTTNSQGKQSNALARFIT